MLSQYWLDLIHSGTHHFPAWRKPGYPWNLGTGVAAVCKHCWVSGGTIFQWELWDGVE